MMRELRQIMADEIVIFGNTSSIARSFRYLDFRDSKYHIRGLVREKNAYVSRNWKTVVYLFSTVP